MMELLSLILMLFAVFGIAMVYPNIGLGGGVLHVPALMFIAGLDKNSAVPVSLLLVLAGAIAALPRHHKAGMVDIRLGAFMSAGAVIGAVCGALINLALSQEVFEWLFVTTIIVVCARMVYDLYRRKDDEVNDDSKMCVSRLVPAFGLSILAGLLGSTFGIGGGLIYVPVMIFILCRKTKLAVGTSTFIIVPTAIVGLLTYAIGGTSNFDQNSLYYAIALVPTALAGAYIGSKVLVEKLTGNRVKALFISLALIVAITMMVSLLL